MRGIESICRAWPTHEFLCASISTENRDYVSPLLGPFISAWRMSCCFYDIWWVAKRMKWNRAKTYTYNTICAYTHLQGEYYSDLTQKTIIESKQTDLLQPTFTPVGSSLWNKHSARTIILLGLLIFYRAEGWNSLFLVNNNNNCYKHHLRSWPCVSAMFSDILYRKDWFFNREHIQHIKSYKVLWWATAVQFITRV